MKTQEKLNFAKEKVANASVQIEEFLNTLSEIEMNHELKEADIETRSLYFHLKHLSDQLAKPFTKEVEYLQKNITAEGTLHLNENGKYEINGFEIQNGSPIEIYIDHDQEEQKHSYYTTRLEYAGQYGGGYFAFHFPNLKLEGVKARIREGLE